MDRARLHPVGVHLPVKVFPKVRLSLNQYLLTNFSFWFHYHTPQMCQPWLGLLVYRAKVCTDFRVAYSKPFGFSQKSPHFVSFFTQVVFIDEKICLTKMPIPVVALETKNDWSGGWRKKNVVWYEKSRKKNSETKLPHLWNHHKNGVVGWISGSVGALYMVCQQNSSVGGVRDRYYYPCP